MAKSIKSRTVYVCSECGYETVKWYGKCPECGNWNTFEEQIKQQTPAVPKGLGSAAAGI